MKLNFIRAAHGAWSPDAHQASVLERAVEWALRMDPAIGAGKPDVPRIYTGRSRHGQDPNLVGAYDPRRDRVYVHDPAELDPESPRHANQDASLYDAAAHEFKHKGQMQDWLPPQIEDYEGRTGRAAAFMEPEERDAYPFGRTAAWSLSADDIGQGKLFDDPTMLGLAEQNYRHWAEREALDYALDRWRRVKYGIPESRDEALSSLHQLLQPTQPLLSNDFDWIRAYQDANR